MLLVYAVLKQVAQKPYELREQFTILIILRDTHDT